MDTYTIEGLSFSYPLAGQAALANISLRIEQGSWLCICGSSGCGKTTLLRHLKPSLAPHGERGGAVTFEGRPLQELTPRAEAEKIGYVSQSPAHQLVTDKVWHELAFGLENLGLPSEEIRRRVAEIAAFFGIGHWFYQDTFSLSGGQKQLLNLASVLVMQPAVLLLDEPTAQLDPVAAIDFLTALQRVNRELGTTVILTEHHLHDAFAAKGANVAVMEKGTVAAFGDARTCAAQLLKKKHPLACALPDAARLHFALGAAGRTPLSVRGGRRLLQSLFENTAPVKKFLPAKPLPPAGEVAAQSKHVAFRYGKKSADAVKDLSARFYTGRIYALLGANGAGKSTALSLFAGVHRPYRGSVSCFPGCKKEVRPKAVMLPQDVQALFLGKTLRADLLEVCTQTENPEQQMMHMAKLCGLETLLERHPYDLSGGEQQWAGIAKVLLTQPRLLLLDEPTKGMDAGAKERLADLLRVQTEKGCCVVMVSHDVPFCARHADECALFFDGAIVAQEPPGLFFGSNSFYTTEASRISRGIFENTVTIEEVIALCTQNRK